MNIKCACIRSVAVFDDFDEHRFSLIRDWDNNKDRAAVIMYNPSRATHVKSDNSVNKCLNRVMDDGYGSLEVVNLFSKMSIDPDNLRKNDKVTTLENFRFIQQAVESASIVIIGWGEEGGKKRRDKKVLDLLKSYQKKLFCFGLTPISKKPLHPRNVGADARLVPYILD